MDTEGNRQNDGEVLEHHRSVGIFIKTCSKDLPWLDYCLKSIRKFGSGFSELVIMADQDCYGSPVLDNVDVRYCPVPANGYLYQQVCKLNADKVLNSDLILFVDSDCVFTHPFTPETFTRAGLPVLIKERWSRFNSEHPVHCWKAITERHTDFEVEFEYMRRMPLIHDRRIFEIVRGCCPGLAASLMQRMDREFSEFNLLGAYADHVIPDSYRMLEVGVDDLPDAVCEQFWSWGGISDDIRLRIEGMLS
jgi:hypothetical protein